MQVVPASEYLSKEERKALLEKSDFLAWKSIIEHYAWIIGAFASVYFFPNVVTVFIALWIIGGKQLACAILMHDTSHHAVFKSKKRNDWIGQWLGAYPVFNNMKAYRPYHFQHHVSNGLEEDPDLLLTRGYPTSKKSMFRKFFRDLSGQTGLKALVGLGMMHLGYLEYNLGGKVVKATQKRQDRWKLFYENMLGGVLVNALIFSFLWMINAPWLYLLWIGAYLTTFQFCLRVRSMAEHSVVQDSTDPYLNTRTTKANFFERLLFAPYHVNYHSEHHLLMSVPPYRLPQLHQILKERNFYKKGVFAPNYWTIIRQATL